MQCVLPAGAASRRLSGQDRSEAQVPRKPQDSEVAKEMAGGIGGRLRALREQQGWTQQDVAGRISLSTESYARIERGQSLPSFPTLARLVDTFGTTSGELLGDESTARPASDEPSGYALPPDPDERAARRGQLRRVKRRNPRRPDEPDEQRQQRRRAAIRVINKVGLRRPPSTAAPSALEGDAQPNSGHARVLTRQSIIEQIVAEAEVLDRADLDAVHRLVRHLAERQAEVFEALETVERVGRSGRTEHTGDKDR